MSVEQLEQKIAPISEQERYLTEINHLRAHRLPNGEYPQIVLDDVLSNLKTAVQEGGIPHAVSTTTHEYIPTSERTGVFMWMGKTAIENAQSGYRFHESEAAHQRVDIEVDEAHHAQEDLRPGVMKLFISPRMSETDADEEIAKKEHLADDDAVRASWLLTDEQGNIKERVLQSLLVKDIPLQAWVDMLQDPENPFGKSMYIDNPDSALSVMQVHRELELPLGLFPDGPVDLLRVVSTYIDDDAAKQSVLKQISLFESDQDELDRQADYIAREWLEFEKEMDTSFYNGEATAEVKRFITAMQHEWNDDDKTVIDDHLFNNSYIMTEKLAAIIEAGKQNTLWSRAGVLTGNEAVIDQIDGSVLQQIKHNEVQMYHAFQANNMQLLHQIEDNNNRLIASQQIKVGGGCSGENSAFKQFNPSTGTYEDVSVSGDILEPPDRFGSLTFNCPKGHKNTRPRGKLIDCCKKCGISVKC